MLRAEEQSSDFRGRKIVTAGRVSVLGSSSDEVQTHGYLGYLKGLMKQITYNNIYSDSHSYKEVGSGLKPPSSFFNYRCPTTATEEASHP